MTNSVFGTDGIRGIYGKTLTTETAYALGFALGKRGNVLIGADNRPSSPALSAATAAGVEDAGGSAFFIGTITTPALYFLLTRRSEDYAVMVTASHNPPAYNGLKVFSREGKLSEEIRRDLSREMSVVTVGRRAFPNPCPHADPLREYEEFLLERVGILKGLTVVVDHAGGASGVFSDLLSRTGARVIPLHLRVSGDRINEGCGALHPEACAEETMRSGADLGIALDGDGDRVIAVTKKGELLDGDALTFLFACRMKARGTLKHDKTVLTVMTNSGVLKSLSDRGIGAITCAVGDSAVCDAMRAEDLNLGGEQSGHIILGDHLMTGDGLLVGAMLLKSLREEGEIAADEIPVRYPQVLLNVPVGDKSVAYDPAVQALAAELKREWKEGRILVRASGTESLVRVMTEHPREEEARRAAEMLREEIGKRRL